MSGLRRRLWTGDALASSDELPAAPTGGAHDAQRTPCAAPARFAEHEPSGARLGTPRAYATEAREPKGCGVHSQCAGGRAAPALAVSALYRARLGNDHPQVGFSRKPATTPRVTTKNENGLPGLNAVLTTERHFQWSLGNCLRGPVKAVDQRSAQKLDSQVRWTKPDPGKAVQFSWAAQE